VPDCGYFADQGPVLTYAMGEGRYDAASLRTALRTARADPPPPADLDARARQRDEVATAHRELYRRLLR
jgi:beta-1,4-mannosyltransferase